MDPAVVNERRGRKAWVQPVWFEPGLVTCLDETV